MGDWRQQSVAQRRRHGAPTTLHDSSWHAPAATPLIRDTMSEAVAGMATVGNPRQPMDRSELAAMVNRSAQGRGIKQPRFSQTAADPALFPTARPAPVLQENAGARYGLKVSAPIPALPEAGPTQANGRIVRGRGTVQSFYGV